jgi:hypothetical protein
MTRLVYKDDDRAYNQQDKQIYGLPLPGTPLISTGGIDVRTCLLSVVYDSLCCSLELFDRCLHFVRHCLHVVIDPVEESALVDDHC